MQFFRQGDVGILRVSDLPPDVTPKAEDAKRGVVLAYGEVTGHAHTINKRGAASLLVDKTGTEFLKVERACSVIHEEHAPIPLQDGVYRIVHQKEYEPSGWRDVAD